MKMANTMTGMRIVISDKEYKALKSLGGRFSVSIMPGSAERFVEIRPFDEDFGRAASISANKNQVEHPWRMEMLANYWPITKTIPQFGSEEVTWELQENSQPKSFVIHRPLMHTPVLIRNRRRPGTQLDIRSLPSSTLPIHDRALAVTRRRASGIYTPGREDQEEAASNEHIAPAPILVPAVATAAAPVVANKMLSLKAAVESVNKWKDLMGEDLTLYITKTGKLGAMSQYGDKE